MSLKTDFKNDKFAGKRKYTLTENDDGTISLDDVTEYETVGDIYGATEVNASNTAINQNTDDIAQIRDDDLVHQRSHRDHPPGERMEQFRPVYTDDFSPGNKIN